MSTPEPFTSRPRQTGNHRLVASRLGTSLLVLCSGWLLSCAGLFARGSRDAGAEGAVPRDLAVRGYGRWTCGAEIPQGGSSPSMDLMNHIGPGKAWRLVVDTDQFAQLRIIEHRGRSRQGCWSQLGSDDTAELERAFQDARVCDRPDDPRGSDVGGSFEISLALPAATCTRHVAAASLQRTATGRRLADELHRWLDRVSEGSFRKLEAFATSGADRVVPRAAVANGRLTCGLARDTIYASGDTWLLEYSFQRGLLWQRNLEVSRGGAVAVDLASLQNGAHLSCTGRLTGAELAELNQVLAESRPCALKTAPSPADESHGYLSARGADTECLYRAIRYEDLLDTPGGRHFDGVVMSLLRQLVGPGGVDPFDERVGLLFERRTLTAGDEKVAARDPLSRARIH